MFDYRRVKPALHSCDISSNLVSSQPQISFRNQCQGFLPPTSDVSTSLFPTSASPTNDLETGEKWWKYIKSNFWGRVTTFEHRNKSPSILNDHAIISIVSGLNSHHFWVVYHIIPWYTPVSLTQFDPRNWLWYKWTLQRCRPPNLAARLAATSALRTSGPTWKMAMVVKNSRGKPQNSWI